MVRIHEHKECYYSKHQREILVMICQNIKPGMFYLTGGTCLSVFYFGHRKSNDLDFFSREESNLVNYTGLFRSIAKVEQTIAESPHFCSYTYSGSVKTDFVYDRFSDSNIRPQIEIDGVSLSLDTLENITANKLCAFVSRFEWKDIVDITMLSLKSTVFDNFKNVYYRAARREKLLEDIAYFNGLCTEVIKNSHKIQDMSKPFLVKDVLAEDIIKAFKQLYDSSLLLLNEWTPGHGPT